MNRPQFRQPTQPDLSDRAHGWVALVLLAIPLCLYVGLAGRWSLDNDEIYTLRDARRPVWEIVTACNKPLHYVLVHYSIQLPLPLEWSVRLPAAFAAALLAPALYLLLSGMGLRRTPLCAAILALANPWVFEFSQFGRHYAPMLLLAAVAMLSLYRALRLGRPAWLVLYGCAAVLAILTHPTAATVLPAGVVGTLGFYLVRDRGVLIRLMKRHARSIVIAAVGGAVLAATWLLPIFQHWLVRAPGSMGDYTAVGLMRAVAIFAGIQVWSLAVLPLITWPRRWSADQAFLAGAVLVSVVPFLVLAQMGGGVSSRYLLQSLPCLLVLAGLHWDQIARQLPGRSHQLALAAVVLSFYVPYGLSTLRDGNHCDYRQAAAFVASLELDQPVIACTSHGMYQHYAGPGAEVHELGSLAMMNSDRPEAPCHARRTVTALIAEAERTGRPLLLVSKEDRRVLSRRVRRWLGERFAMLACIESPRFDHRRNQLVIYEYRPAARTAPPDQRGSEATVAGRRADGSSAARPSAVRYAKMQTFLLADTTPKDDRKQNLTGRPGAAGAAAAPAEPPCPAAAGNLHAARGIQAVGRDSGLQRGGDDRRDHSARPGGAD